MKNRVIDVFIIICFILMLALPLYFADKKGGALQSDENRFLAKAPKSWTPYEGYTEDIEDWIDDNVGGRQIAKTFYNYLIYGFMNEFRSDAAVVMNDWYYSLDEESLTLKNAQHKDVMTNEEMMTFISRMEDINNFFKDQGIAFCAVTFPYKVDIYPDNLNGYITQVRPNSEINLLKTISMNYPQINLSVVNNELRDAKDAGKLVCYRSYDGGHWNQQGCFIGYQTLMAQIQKVMPHDEIKILTEDDFNISILERTNTVLGQNFSEEDVEYTLKDPVSVRNPEWFSKIGYVANDPWHSNRYYESGDTSKPDILIVGDSYIWMQMFPWIAESFNKAAFIHQFDEDNIQRIVDRIHPDIVVFAGLTTTIEDLVHYSALTIERTTWGKLYF
ncbi:MAG TPA: hypothetical protein DCX23_01145 [Lachnospiraceae bacterium]|jgi:hypothetical protein|nr:hypothetical protein [Lachnospiraceae bacterium]